MFTLGCRLREGGFLIDNLLAKIRQCQLSAGSLVRLCSDTTVTGQTCMRRALLEWHLRV